MIGALLELQFADPKRQDELNCGKCPERIRKLRRCEEDRWDFDVRDAAFWPMRVSPHGALYGFCPAKAAWDRRVVSVYNALVVSAETGAQWQSGGIADQPAWWIELIAWFVPSYNELRFSQRARAILGDGKESSHGTRKRRT
jgi:hypothetical protein